MKDSAKADSHPTVVSRLRAFIQDAVYAPGDLMPEITLARELGVSRTPIREALKMLENEGLVEIRPRVGTFVRIPTRREIVELFQMKEVFEGLAASLMARRGDIPQLRLLHQNIKESDEALVRQDQETYASLVHEFHWTIVRGADSQKLLEHYERLMNQLAYHRLVKGAVRMPGRHEASTAEHHRVLEAIESKDPVSADAVMRSHVYSSSIAALRATTNSAAIPAL